MIQYGAVFWGWQAQFAIDISSLACASFPPQAAQQLETERQKAKNGKKQGLTAIIKQLQASKRASKGGE
jgi:hypothetical protein